MGEAALAASPIYLEGEARMPYKTLGDLPKSVRESLPRQAQQIFLRAYNNAWKQYDQPGERRAEATRDGTAARVAWGAVKRRYVKDEGTGKWKEKR